MHGQHPVDLGLLVAQLGHERISVVGFGGSFLARRSVSACSGHTRPVLGVIQAAGDDGDGGIGVSDGHRDAAVGGQHVEV